MSPEGSFAPSILTAWESMVFALRVERVDDKMQMPRRDKGSIFLRCATYAAHHEVLCPS
jgi:hypothetical protein